MSDRLDLADALDCICELVHCAQCNEDFSHIAEYLVLAAAEANRLSGGLPHARNVEEPHAHDSKFWAEMVSFIEPLRLTPQQRIEQLQNGS